MFVEVLMNKGEFINKYRKAQITIWFKDNIFLNDEAISIRDANYKISSLGEFYCPWHYDHNNNLIGAIEQAICDPDARSVQLKSSETIHLDRDKENIILSFRNNFPEFSNPVPVATDLNTKRTLILDANKRCIALYRNYLDNKVDEVIPFIEVDGQGLERLVEDFKIINR